MVFIGFAPTFFLRPFLDPTTFDPPILPGSMPVHIIGHGVFLTAWYLMLVLQAVLVVRHRVGVHRLLGIFGCFVATGVVLTGIQATLGAIPNAADVGIPREVLVSIVVANSINLVAFSGLVVFAVYFRTRPEIHKRCMLIASIVIIGPALTVERFLGHTVQLILPEFISFDLLFWVSVLAALMVHDYTTHGRVLVATVWTSLVKVTTVAAAATVVSIGMGGEYVAWLNLFNTN